jgi:hypothetical protein
MGEFTVTLREEDLYRGFRLAAANRSVRPLIVAALATATLLAILLTLSPEARAALGCNALILMLEGAVLLAASLLGAVLLLRNPVWRSLSRRTLAQRRELATPIEWAFDERSLRIASRFTRSEFPWDALSGWRDDERTLLVYLADSLFHTVPKEQVADMQVAALCTALESHGVPRK